MTNFFDPHGGHSTAFRWLMFLSAFVSSALSVLQLVLIRKMKVYNGHILLIQAMAIGQLIYDVSFYPGVITIGIDWVVVMANVMQLIGGISVSVYSNVMASVVLIVILKKRSYDIIGNFLYYNIATFVIVSVMVILYLMAEINPIYSYLAEIALSDLYYYGRLVSIFYNFVACGLAYYFVKRMTFTHKARTIQVEAISQLASRMQFYPLVQAVSRAGCAWYELAYGWNFDPPQVTPLQFVSQLSMAILTPAASIGYFILFLKMQPNAMNTLKNMLSCSKRDDAPSATTSTVGDDSSSNPIVSDSKLQTNSVAPSSASTIPTMACTEVMRTSIQFTISPDVYDVGGQDDEDDEDNRSSRLSTVRESMLLNNVERYSQGNLNIKAVSDDELFDIIDTYGRPMSSRSRGLRTSVQAEMANLSLATKSSMSSRADP